MKKIVGWTMIISAILVVLGLSVVESGFVETIKGLAVAVVIWITLFVGISLTKGG